MKNKSILIKGLIAIIFFAILSFVSECLYVYKQQGKSLLSAYLAASSLLNHYSFTEPTVSLLFKAGKIKYKDIIKKYPEKNLPRFNVSDIPDNRSLYVDFNVYFSNKNLNNLSVSSANIWAKMFYELALISYNHGEKELAEVLLKDAVLLGPEWSYFHRELANYYISRNDKELAGQAVKYCIEFEFPKPDCIEYSNNNLANKIVRYDVGFLKDNINNEINK